MADLYPTLGVTEDPGSGDNSLEAGVIYACTATEQVGDFVYFSAPGTVEQADASNASKMPVIGMIETKPTATTCTVTVQGVRSSLPFATTEGAHYFISNTPGQASTLPPAEPSQRQRVGMGLGNNAMFVQPGEVTY